ncbi:MAG: SfnB family sulfur acquisition oxidoreductase [Marmoricola sp.]|nr:SfnB family sulfur acquisition oxidoreductase [Marmoricola sp.]
MTIEHLAPARVATIRDAAHALQTAEELAREFARGAGKRDRDRRLPYDEIRRLANSGLLTITVPREYGGPGLPPSVVAEVFRRIARADPNIAQIPHSHFVYANLVRVAASPQQQADLFGKVLEGKLFANAQSERGGKTIKDISTTLTATPEGRLSLTGAKYYCTGTLFADIIPVLARLEDPRGTSGLREGEQIVFIPAISDGVSILDDWDGVGQRLTASGTILFDQIDVDPDWVVARHEAFDQPNGYGAFAQLLHASIDVGIARAALEDAAEFVRTKSRPWFEAEVGQAVDDPLVIQRFGELSVTLTAAEAVLELAGRSVDEVFANPADQTAARASLDVAAAKVLGERASVELASALFEVSGTRSAASCEHLDRHWRNARTHTLHDPIRWKYQHLGRFVLTGQTPPRHGTI